MGGHPGPSSGKSTAEMARVVCCKAILSFGRRLSRLGSAEQFRALPPVIARYLQIYTPKRHLEPLSSVDAYSRGSWGFDAHSPAYSSAGDTELLPESEVGRAEEDLEVGS